MAPVEVTIEKEPWKRWTQLPYTVWVNDKGGRVICHGSFGFSWTARWSARRLEKRLRKIGIETLKKEQL